MSRSGRRTLAALALAVVLAAGHVVYHYLPRARASTPAERGAVARLFAASDYPMALWVPYPHQNLAVLDRAVGDGATYAAAVARLAELEPLRLPAFGPFAVPPSSQLAVASSTSGERFAVAAEVYPSLALFARLAGKVAGNPWLAGGEVEVSGRVVEVAWEGRVWTVHGGAAPQAAVVEPLPTPPSLGLFHLRRATEDLPADLYRLERTKGGLEVRSTREVAAEVGLRRAALDELGAVMLLVSARGDDELPAARALVYLEPERGSLELPRVASLHQGGRERYRLPGERLLKIAGREPRRAEHGGWRLAALDRSSLKAARPLTAELEPLLASGRLERGAWLRPAGALEEVERIGRILEEIPLVPRREVERSRDARAVLEPLAARYEWLSLVVTREPPALRLRLEEKR